MTNQTTYYEGNGRFQNEFNQLNALAPSSFAPFAQLYSVIWEAQDSLHKMTTRYKNESLQTIMGLGSYEWEQTWDRKVRINARQEYGYNGSSAMTLILASLTMKAFNDQINDIQALLVVLEDFMDLVVAHLFSSCPDMVERRKDRILLKWFNFMKENYKDDDDLAWFSDTETLMQDLGIARSVWEEKEIAAVVQYSARNRQRDS